MVTVPKQMDDPHPINLLSRRELVLLLVACRDSVAQQLHGRWGATVQERNLGGTWTARPLDEPDAVQGTWSLQDPAGGQLAYGTWSARKVKDKWEGRWQAEVEGGRKHAGSWTAHVDRPGSSPLIDLFRLAWDQIVSGTWNSENRLSGAWSIRADR